MKDRAYAKINLALDVFNIRDNGFHEINSIMIPINFYDELEIRINDQNVYECNRSFIHFNENNSIIKMINLVKQRYSISDNYYINLNKVVPIQAGLGGGTSDAASTLRILKKLYKLSLSSEEEKDICLAVGSDVLFNYYNRPAIVSGIGDQIEFINIKKEYYILIIKPKLGVSTKEAYNLLDMDICDHPNIDKLKTALVNGNSIDGLLGNSLELPALQLNNEITKIKNAFIQEGYKNVLMSGSGSSVFVISEDNNEIEKASKLLKNSKYYIRTTKTINIK